MLVRLAWCAIVAGVLCSGQTEAPAFEAARVLPSGHSRSIPLAPGLLFSIYGNHLGPSQGCEGYADTQHRETPSVKRLGQMFVNTLIYPKSLCDAQVLVGGVPAGLLYVQAKQINFKVPQEASVEGPTEIQVIYKGQSSRPVPMAVGLDLIFVSLESPARVGGPVWLKIEDFGGGIDVRYPFAVEPWRFGCHVVEVRKNGTPLVPIPQPQPPFVSISGNMCGSLGLPGESHHTGRIPLHLQYRFDQAGTYEVRYLHRNTLSEGGVMRIESKWTPIEILPGTAGERTRWLQQLIASVPADAVTALTDFLPSILGVPDKQSLELVSDFLYHPDSVVRQYAMYGLMDWPTAEAESRVRELIGMRGPSDAAVQFLIRTPTLLAAHGDFVVAAAIPYLRSDSPMLLRGAVAAVYRAPSSPAVRRQAEEALIAAADHVVRAADSQTLNDYACALGVAADPRAGAVLWNLIDRNAARGQSMIALTWRHVPADLPRLAAMMQSPGEFYSIPYALRNGYGDAAVPFLETLLKRGASSQVRTESARELILALQPSGFQFLAVGMEDPKQDVRELVEFVRSQFPELRIADKAAVLAFAKDRAGAR